MSIIVESPNGLIIEESHSIASKHISSTHSIDIKSISVERRLYSPMRQLYDGHLRFCFSLLFRSPRALNHFCLCNSFLLAQLYMVPHSCDASILPLGRKTRSHACNKQRFNISKDIVIEITCQKSTYSPNLRTCCNPTIL